MARVMGPRTCLDFAEIGPAMLFSGVMPADCYTLVFVTKCPQKGNSFNFGMEHLDGYLGFFPPGGLLDAMTPEGYANATLTVPAEVFHGALGRWYPDIPDALLKRGGGMRVGRVEQVRLRNLLTAVMEAVVDASGPLAGMRSREVLETELLEEFLRALRSGGGTMAESPTRRAAGRLRHLRQAREFIRSSAHEATRVSDLSRALQMSERGVEVLFRESLGIPPSVFIRHQRLHGVRRALLESGPGLGAVKGTALEWGFWHMGHFSRNYRKLFGESPSATLQR